MSAGVIVGIIIIVLVLGVPIVQAGLRSVQHRRSLRAEGVRDLLPAAIASADLPSGFAMSERRAMSSEKIAWGASNPGDTMRDLDAAGHLISLRQQFRDPRSFGELIDVLLTNTVRRNAPHRRVELTLSRYENAEQAAAALDKLPEIGEQDTNVRVEDVTNGDDLRAREWTRLDGETPTQRMLELRWSQGAVHAELVGDSEPPGALDDTTLRELAKTVRSRLR